MRPGVTRARRAPGDPGPPRAQGVGDPVAGDGDQPARQRTAFRVEGVPPASGRHENLLGDVLGVSGGRQGLAGEAVDQGAETLLEEPERVGVSLSERGRDILIRRRVHRAGSSTRFARV